MAIKIDNDLLASLGLGSLPDVEKNGLLRHIYETLEMRVGIRLADQMSNEQLDEFEQYFEAKDDAGAFKWLETNFPNYKEIVQEEFDKLKAEVGQAAPQILSASQAQTAAVPPPAPGASVPPAGVAPQPSVGYQQPATPPAPGVPPAAAPAPAQPYAAPPVPQQQPPQPYPSAPPQTGMPMPPSVSPQSPSAQPQPGYPQNPPYPPQQPPAGPPPNQ